MKENLTKAELMLIRVGQTRTFLLPNKAKVESARVMARQLKKENMEFDIHIEKEINTITLTRTH